MGRLARVNAARRGRLYRTLILPTLAWLVTQRAALAPVTLEEEDAI